jgi:hypothetical protein
VNLQTVIREWESERQLGLIRDKLSRLRALQMSASGACSGLIGEYALVLEEYSRHQKTAATHGLGRNFVANRKVLASTAIRRLNELDARRKVLESPR